MPNENSSLGFEEENKPPQTGASSLPPTPSILTGEESEKEIESLQKQVGGDKKIEQPQTGQSDSLSQAIEKKRIEMVGNASSAEALQKLQADADTVKNADWKRAYELKKLENEHERENKKIDGDLRIQETKLGNEEAQNLRNDAMQQRGFYSGMGVALALLVVGLAFPRQDRIILLLLGAVILVVALAITSPLVPKALEALGRFAQGLRGNDKGDNTSLPKAPEKK